MATLGGDPQKSAGGWIDSISAEIPKDRGFEEIAGLAARVCGAPSGVIVLRGKSRLIVCAASGWPEGEPPPLESHCREAIEQGEVREVSGETPSGNGTCVPFRMNAGRAAGALVVCGYIGSRLSQQAREDLSVLSRQAGVLAESVSSLNDRDRAAEALRAAERLARIGTWRLLLHNNRLEWSPTVYEICGADPKRFDLRYSTFLKLVHQQDSAMVSWARERAVRGAGLDLEFRIVRPDGEIRWVHVRGELADMRVAEKAALQGTVQDITERRQTARELETIFQHSKDLICFAGADGTWRRTSPSFHRVLGWSSSELKSRSCVDLIHPDDLPRPEPDGELCAKEGKPTFEYEARFLAADGRYRLLSWLAIPVPERRMILGVGRDITEQRELEERVRSSMRQLHAILESVLDMVVVINHEWEFTYVNAEAERVLKRSREAMIGKNAWDVCPELATSPHAEYLRNAESSRHCITFEDYCKPLQRWLEMRAFPFPDGIVVYFRDRTEDRAAEEKLRISEERLNHVAHATNDALWDWDLRTDEIWWSQGFERYFGYTVAGVNEGTNARIELIHPEDREGVQEGIGRVIEAGGERWTEEYRFRRKDGSYAYVLERGTVIRSSGGTPIRMLGGVRDVTARHEAEMRLQQQAALLDQARDAIIVRDLEGTITYWNRGARRIYGWSAEEAVGQPVGALLEMEPLAYDTANQQLLAAGGWSGEITHIRKDGEPVVAEVSWTLLCGTDGSPRSVLAIHTDVTEKKQLEAQFLRAQRMEGIGTLAGGIAHDLNNMLTPVLVGMGLLRSRIKEPDLLPVLDSIESRAQQGAELIRQVLFFARGGEGQRTLVQVGAILKDLAAILRGSLPKAIYAEIQAANDLWSLRADATQVHQVVLNLSVNARDAMPEGGTVRIRAENRMLDEHSAALKRQGEPGPYVMIEVCDEGVGIPPGLHERIFDPFFTTKEVGRGTGLGLSTVLAIVKAHGGFLTMTSEVGQGTTIRVFFPADPSGVPHEASGGVPSVPRGHGELILVIDDEQEVREITALMLEAFGYRAVTAQDGAAGVAVYAARRGEIAAVITDMMMPVMDGKATIFALRRIQPNVRIIATSGVSDTGNGPLLSVAGATHFLHKPYSTEKLLGLLHAVLKDRVAD